MLEDLVVRDGKWAQLSGDSKPVEWIANQYAGAMARFDVWKSKANSTSHALYAKLLSRIYHPNIRQTPPPIRDAGEFVDDGVDKEVGVGKGLSQLYEAITEWNPSFCPNFSMEREVCLVVATEASDSLSSAAESDDSYTCRVLTRARPGYESPRSLAT